MFKIETGYYLKFLRPVTVKCLGSTRKRINKNKNGENIPHLEITEVVLFHVNIANNHYQHDSRILHTFVSNKSFSLLLHVSPKSFIFKKKINSEFSYIEVWFSDQNLYH